MNYTKEIRKLMNQLSEAAETSQKLYELAATAGVRSTLTFKSVTETLGDYGTALTEILEASEQRENYNSVDNLKLFLFPDRLKAHMAFVKYLRDYPENVRNAYSNLKRDMIVFEDHTRWYFREDGVDARLGVKDEFISTYADYEDFKERAVCNEKR